MFAIAAVINGISKAHRDFLKAGGYGFIIGDGKLDYGNEDIVEAYYNAKLSAFLWITADYQFVDHPGYNKDRGPVNIVALRGHIEFKYFNTLPFNYLSVSNKELYRAHLHVRFQFVMC